MANPADPLTGRRTFLLQTSLGVASLLGAEACASDDPPAEAAPAALPRLAIVGGGVAGVCAAWLLDGQFATTLYEAEEQLGGNVRTLTLEAQGGEPVLVDIGAQYYHPKAYPTYSALLELLEIASPDDADPGDAYAAPSSVTVYVPGAPNPVFVSPILPDKTWPLGAAWNLDGIDAFQKMTARAVADEAAEASFATPLEDWLATLDLTTTQREDICLPWAASLISGDIAQVRKASARSVLTFLARAAPANPLETVRYRTLKHGLGSVLDALVAQCSTLTVRTGSPVVAVTRDDAGLRVETGSETVAYDAILVAAPAHAAAKLLAGLGSATAQVQALEKIRWFDAELRIHRDRAYAPAIDDNVSFLNCEVHGGYCEASMNLGICLPPLPSGAPVDLWKSWTTHRDAPPAESIAEAKFTHLDPSPETIAAQEELGALQGDGGVWFVGGWTRPFDAQETALLSALAVAESLAPEAPHRVALAARLSG